MNLKVRILLIVTLLCVSFDGSACPDGISEFKKVIQEKINITSGHAHVETRVTTAHLAQHSKSSTEISAEGIAISGQEARATEMLDGITITSQKTKNVDAINPQFAQQFEKETARFRTYDYVPESVIKSDVGAQVTLSAAQERSRIRSLASVDVFKKTYAKSTLEFDNRNFISSMDNIPNGKKAVYFDVENSVLKQLNDEIFETKDLGDAAGNLFNRILYDKIQKTPELAQKLNGKYRDFKSLRFQFLLDEGEDSKKILDLLKKVYGQSAAEFERELKATGLGPLWNARIGQAGDPEKWFLAGAGNSPLEANMAARQSRGMLSEMGTSNRMVLYSDRVDVLATDIREVEKIRNALGDIPTLQKSNIVIDSGNGNVILSKDAISVLRKTKRGDFKNLDDYRKAVNKQFQKVFGTKVDNNSIDGMTKYFEGVDALSPPLFVRSRTGIDLSQANNGLVSVDFTGVGVDNAYEAMIGLAKTSSKSGTNTSYVDKALKTIDAHVDNVTDSMNSSKKIFNQSTKNVTGSDRSAVFSGDDGMYFPDTEWTRSSKQELVDNLSSIPQAGTAKADPSKYRVTFVSTKYKEGAEIPTALRSEYIVKAEKVEKDIRKAVVGVGEGQISPEKAKDMLIAIEYKPGKNSTGDWDIIFGGKVDHIEQTILRRSLETIIEQNKY